MKPFVSFIVEGKPVGKGRPRITTRSGIARAFTPELTRNYESLVSLFAHRAMMNAGRVPTCDAVRVVIEANFPIPASYSKKKQQQCIDHEIRPTVKPDIDNIAKAILDGMNGVVYVDDKQVVECTVEKYYTKNSDGFVVVVVYTEF